MSKTANNRVHEDEDTDENIALDGLMQPWLTKNQDYPLELTCRSTDYVGPFTLLFAPHQLVDLYKLLHATKDIWGVTLRTE